MALLKRAFSSSSAWLPIKTNARPSFAREPTVLSAQACIDAVVVSNQRIFLHGGAATPPALVRALEERILTKNDLHNLETVHLHIETPIRFGGADFAHALRPNALFVGGNLREAVANDRADYTPIFLSEIPLLFKRGILPLDVAMVSVTEPDAHGYVSLGVSVDCAVAALHSAKINVAQVNKKMPRLHGDGVVHISHFDYLVREDAPLPTPHTSALSATDSKIGQLIAEQLVEDGSTLQMGIGNIPNAALAALANHKDLGVHTEMFSDGVMKLMKTGVINNMKKSMFQGRLISSFLTGSRELYDFVHDNPSIEMLTADITNSTTVIAQQHKMVAINSCIEVDLTGQVASDSIGTRIYSGVGGQMDFIRGASLGVEGKPIIALPSRTGKGISRITPVLKEGAGVVTTRAHVHYVVTENGIADLFGKSLSKRARALIDIAHPDDRPMLEDAARKRFINFKSEK